MGGGNIVVIQSHSEWATKHKQAAAAKKIVVVDFTATWCGPCQKIAPVFESLSTQYPNAVFLKVDVDENQDIMADCGIRGMPTFFLYSEGAKVDELVGASPPMLEALVKKHYKESTFSRQGQKLGASSSSSQLAPARVLSTQRPLDESKPLTSIQIRLADGKRIVGKFNTTHTVGDIRSFVTEASPSTPLTFELIASFPPKPLVDYAQTIEEAGLINSSLQVK